MLLKEKRILPLVCNGNAIEMVACAEGEWTNNWTKGANCFSVVFPCQE